MPLTAGQTLSFYEILGPLGAGGMGEVYRAKDTRLDREVAIKVLPEEMADDEERLRRFEREAKTLASLNHPNVAGIHGVDQEGDICFLALELVPGEDLSTRISRGALPVDEAIEVCRQIAEGLEAAHEAGVVHRDLKPANIRITPDGIVKLLDFGLAKPMHPKLSSNGLSGSAQPDSFLMTEEGLVLGTPTYMSPEQARGKPIDRRTDIWAFGCVLFECLTGKRAFGGESMTDVLASILEREPDHSRLPSRLPAHVGELIRRCLVKQARSRLRDIGDARLELECEFGSGGAGNGELLRPMTRSPLALVLASFAGLAAGLIGASLWSVGNRVAQRPADGADEPNLHTEIVLQPGTELAYGATPIGFDYSLLALSPDGRWLVHVGVDDKGTRLYLRDLHGFGPAQPLDGTEGALHAFFSPLGDDVGFTTSRTLKRVALDGGGVLSIADVETCVRAVWASNGYIYYADNEGRQQRRVPEAGGTVETGGSFSGLITDVLPDGSGALLAHRRLSINGDYARIKYIDLASGTATTLIDNGYDPRFLPGGRRIVFARGGQLFSMAFDPETRSCVGEPTLVLSGVAMESLFGQGQYVVSKGGDLAFIPGGDRSLGRLAWMNRDGERGSFGFAPRVYGALDLDDKDARIAVHVGDIMDHVLICDLVTGEERVLRRRHRDGWPIWSHGGELLAFSTRNDEASFSLNMVGLAPGAEAVTLISDNRYCNPSSWAADDSLIGYYGSEQGTAGGAAARAIDMQANSVVIRPDALMPVFSPNGGWVAATSRSSGGFEVHLISWPDGDVAHRLPIEHALEPQWAQNGEVFVRRGDQWWSVSVETEPELSTGIPVLAFETPFLDTPGISYDISSDGERLFFVEQALEDVTDRIRVINAWTDSL